MPRTTHYLAGLRNDTSRKSKIYGVNALTSHFRVVDLTIDTDGTAVPYAKYRADPAASFLKKSV